MSLKFPQDGLTLLPLVSRENDSPRCAGHVRTGAVVACKIRMPRFQVTHAEAYTQSQQLVAFKFERTNARRSVGLQV